MRAADHGYEQHHRLECADGLKPIRRGGAACRNRESPLWAVELAPMLPKSRIFSVLLLGLGALLTLLGIIGALGLIGGKNKHGRSRHNRGRIGGSAVPASR